MDTTTIKVAMDRIREIEQGLLTEGKDDLTASLLAQDAVPAPSLQVVNEDGMTLREYPMGWHDWAKACEKTGSCSESIVSRGNDQDDDQEEED